MSGVATGDETACRNAIVSFFSTPLTYGVQHFYRDEPVAVIGGTWPITGGWGAFGYIHLDTDMETRITLGGQVGTQPTGQKQINRTVSVIVCYQYMLRQQTTPALQGDEWVEPLDDIITALKARIRSDPTFGTGAGGEIFQAGQNAGDIRIHRDLPKLTPQGGKVQSWNRLEFDLTQIITA